MFALAEKYDIEGLRVLSLEKFSSRLENSSTALEFLESVPDVYTLTAPSVRSLRDEVTLFATIDLQKYLQDQSNRHRRINSGRHFRLPSGIVLPQLQSRRL